MGALELYFAPDSCARVPLIALEEIGCEYEISVIAFMKGEHRSEEYLALKRSGKVPTLLIDGEPLTENVAILNWLSEAYPKAKLLPKVNGIAHHQQISDLAYCASVLHPIVTRLRMSQIFCTLPEAQANVFAMAETAMAQHFEYIDKRLSLSQWWYGDQWSIIDAYINWVWFRVSGTMFNARNHLNFFSL